MAIKKPNFPPNLALLISISAVSTASVLIRIADAPAMAVATWRLVLSTLILLPLFISNGGVKKLQTTNRSDLIVLAGVGFVLAIHFASWITSLNLTSIASSVIFVHVDPILVALVSHFLVKERVTKRVAFGIVIALVGVFVIAIGDFKISETNLIGDLLSLLGAIALGIYLLAGRSLRQRLDLTSYVTPVYAISSITLFFGSLFWGIPLVGYNANQYFVFAMIALVPMIFGHTVYNWALRWVSAPIVSISLLGEPIGASLLAFIILNEAPTLTTVVGGAVTLIGILISVYKPRDVSNS